MITRVRIGEFLRFCLVGGIGFLVDWGVLEQCVEGGMPTLPARTLSILVALQVTYVLHEAFTFRTHAGYRLRRWLQFAGWNLLGGAVNLAVFMGMVQLLGGVVADAWIGRLLAMVTGTAVALVFNYWANRRFVFLPVITP